MPGIFLFCGYLKYVLKKVSLNTKNVTQCQIIYDDHHLHYLASPVINVFTISNYEALGICRISEIKIII